jgi:pyrroloquinoline quinone (PQQ) biosynthesis protein C
MAQVEVSNGWSAVEAPALLNELLPADKIVELCTSERVAEHHLFERLRSNPVDMPALWVLVANTHAGISPNFVRWLATTIARSKDRRLACLIAKQLYDELGNGQPHRVHATLLERFVTALEPWSPPDPQDKLWAGQRLAESTTPLFEGSNPFTAIGALIVAEVFAKDMDGCLGEEIRRQDLLPEDSLTWIRLHEVLEIDHAEDSNELAALVPDDAQSLRATWEGARVQWQALWQFLDDVDAIVDEVKAGEPRSKVAVRESAIIQRTS